MPDGFAFMQALRRTTGPSGTMAFAWGLGCERQELELLLESCASKSHHLRVQVGQLVALA